MPFHFDNTYARLPARFYAAVTPTRVVNPSLLAVNDELLDLFGLSREELTAELGVAALAGNQLPAGAEPIALAYAGHQFGGFVPRLGDGRAILLGEIVGKDQRRYDVQLKGAGRTPFSRGGDGRAALGPVLREYLVSETMAALGVPTTRALAAVSTGQVVQREHALPGAVLTRVAASHIRIGTFEYFANQGDKEALQLLTDYTLARHYPNAERRDGAALALLDQVIQRQATLMAKWLALGFVHGVMNTDNTTLSGETLDYGPCAFLDAFDRARTFSSIDHGGRYAYSNQPRIALWNLTRLAECLLPLVDSDEERGAGALSERLNQFQHCFNTAHTAEFGRKLGIHAAEESDTPRIESLLSLMSKDKVDFTICFRRLSDAALHGTDSGVVELFEEPLAFQAWAAEWRQRLAASGSSQVECAALMRRNNPAFIPRNHRVEEMIQAATQGDLQPFERLRAVLSRPYEDQPEAADLALPPGEQQWLYRTFCGT